MQFRSNIMDASSPNSILEAGIHQLESDRTNGAQVLATNAVVILQNVIASLESIEATSLWTEIRLAAYRLSTSRPSMGSAITSALTHSLKSIENSWIEILGSDWFQESPNSQIRQQDLKEIAKNTLSDILLKRSQTTQLLGNEFSQYLLENFASTQPLRILTLSSSSSLKHCLLQSLGQISGLSIDLRILESRPRCEGATFGLNLLNTLSSELKMCGPVGGHAPSLKIVVAPDSHVCHLAKDADIVFIGSDRISDAGDVSNKMGSLAAVLCAKQISPNARVVVLSESDKIARSGVMGDHIVESNDAGEVVLGWDKESQKLYHTSKSEDLVVENIYFEWVPARYIDVYVTEKGILDAEQIRAISVEKERLEKEVFGEEIVALAAERI